MITKEDLTLLRAGMSCWIRAPLREWFSESVMRETIALKDPATKAEAEAHSQREFQEARAIALQRDELVKALNQKLIEVYESNFYIEEKA